MALTCDTLVEGVHWDKRLSAEDVGWKAVAVNASDIAAMGGRPTWALLALSLPAPVCGDWVEGFARGLHAALDRWGIALVGGDTTRSPGLCSVGISMGGTCTRPIPRSGARVGDALWVTGCPGRAALGFYRDDPDGLAALRRPTPPVAFGAGLAALPVTAMMDVSDGLATDLPRLCAASGVGAAVDPRRLPVTAALGADPERLALQVAFGDDYELLFTAPPSAADAVRDLAAQEGVTVTEIGRITAEGGARLSRGEWPAPRFRHFRGSR